MQLRPTSGSVMVGTLELMWSHQERQWAERARDSGLYPSREAREEVLDVHRSILDAIDRGDADYAAKPTQGRNQLVQAVPVQGPLRAGQDDRGGSSRPKTLPEGRRWTTMWQSTNADHINLRGAAR